MVELDVIVANLGSGDVVAGRLDLSTFSTLQHSQNIGKKVQGPCAVGSGSATIVKEWNLFDQSLNFFSPWEHDGKVLVQPPREVLVNGAKQWSNAMIANFLEEKCSRKGVQINVGTKDGGALNSSSEAPDISIKPVEIEDGIDHVGAIGSSVVVSNIVVSIESLICIRCAADVEPADTIVSVEVSIVNELLGSNKFEALVNTTVEQEWVVLSPQKTARGVTELLNQKLILVTPSADLIARENKVVGELIELSKAEEKFFK
ncbi:hypothetical protein V6N12_014202 [Hibiscus sabdariffa]|uniref:Uncharacterized protein n=1 Tax=Hibiscus sabdariffa TaxID=183260 RepID=A0ABR2DJG4_9ROSI